MAGEEIYVASAIHTIGVLAVFIYLMWQSKTKFWNSVWLIGTFLVLLYSFSIETEMWDVAGGAVANLESLSTIYFTALTMLIILAFAYLILQMGLWALEFLNGSVTGRGKDEPS